MTSPPLNSASPLQDAVRAAAARPEVRAAVQAIYARLATEIDQRRPLCIVSGRCCHFEDFGHRLFVTTAELATFLHHFENMPKSAQLIDSIQNWNGTGCPFQVAKMCGVHALRPFGCRIFFCDQTSTQWQNEAYETFHAQLKRLHEDQAIPYFYTEWRQALNSLSLLNPEPSTLNPRQLSKTPSPFDKKSR